MNKYFKIKNEDFELIRSLLNVTKSISKIYDVLYELEINGEKDSAKYTKYLEYLNIALEVENKYYNNMSVEQCLRVYKFIESDFMPKKYEDNNESIIFGVNTIGNARRIITTLDNIIDNNNYFNFIDEEKELDEFDDEEFELFEDFFQSPPQIVIEIMDCNDKEKIQDILDMIINQQFDYLMDSNIDIDSKDFEKAEYDGFVQLFYINQILNNYLIYIKNLEQDDKLKKYKNKFIKTKYDISFTNKIIESKLKENNFDVNENDFNAGLCDIEILGLKEDIYNQVFNEHMLRQAVYNIKELLNVKNNEYKDDDIERRVLLRKALINATLLNIDERCLTKISLNYMASLKKIKNVEEITISKSVIDSIFAVVKKDRKKSPQYVFKKN